ncbi:putative reverse transcriptase domain-containing protein [Tanacetum coccineum]
MIMDEAHRSKYSVHLGADKMYHDLRDMYWWPGIISFEILERIGLVAYRLRLPEELSEIKVDKTLHFVEEAVEIIDREVKRLKHSKISLLKVCWNSKRGPEFTWEREDYMKSKYPQLFVDRAVESAS